MATPLTEELWSPMAVNGFLAVTTTEANSRWRFEVAHRASESEGLDDPIPNEQANGCSESLQHARSRPSLRFHGRALTRREPNVFESDVELARAGRL